LEFLPSIQAESVDVAVANILAGKFRWLLRKRLRITLVGDKKNILEPALELHK
jgi:hypothetical protein